MGQLAPIWFRGLLNYPAVGMRIWTFVTLILGLTLPLQGCDLLDRYATQNGAKQQDGSGTVVAPQNRDTVPVARPEPMAALQSISRPGVKPTPEDATLDPKSLLGKDEYETRDILGPPSVVRAAASATIWHYQAGNCSLDLFFYMDLGTRSLKTLDYEFKNLPPAADKPTNSACAEHIRKTNRVERN